MEAASRILQPADAPLVPPDRHPRPPRPPIGFQNRCHGGRPRQRSNLPRHMCRRGSSETRLERPAASQKACVMRLTVASNRRRAGSRPLNFPLVSNRGACGCVVNFEISEGSGDGDGGVGRRGKAGAQPVAVEPRWAGYRAWQVALVPAWARVANLVSTQEMKSPRQGPLHGQLGLGRDPSPCPL